MPKPPAPPRLLFEILEEVRAHPRPAYQARDRRDGRLVYLKLARSRSAALREARALRRVASPFTPSSASLHRSGEAYWIAIEWIAGTPLSRGVQAPGPWITDLMRCVSHIHRWGIVHGDLKPENALISNDGRVRLIDFEFATRTGEEVPFAEAGGTQGFVAPERLSGWPADPRSDLYSLAMTLRALDIRHPVVDRLVAEMANPMPGRRPSRIDASLHRVSEALGRGFIPPPSLAFAKWSRERIHLEDLSLGIASYLGCDRDVSRGVADALQTHSGGVLELAEPIWNSWLPRVKEDPWGPTDPDRITGALPAMREEAGRIVRERWASTPGELRIRLSRIALLGSRFSDEDLDRLAMAIPGANLSIESLVDGGIVQREGETSWRFVTEDAWVSALDDHDPSAAPRIHRALAGRIEADAGGLPAPIDARKRLAWQYLRAGMRDRAREVSFRAGEDAFSQGRNEDAVSFFRSAWESVLPAGGPGAALGILASSDLEAVRDDLFRWAAMYGTALAYTDRHQESEEWMGALRTLARNEEEMVTYHRCMADLCQRTRRTEKLLHHVDAGLALVRDDAGAEGDLHLLRAQALVGDSNRIDEGIAAAERASALLDCAGNARNLSTARTVLGVALYQKQQFFAARERMVEALEIGARADLPFQQALVHTNLVAVEDRLGNRPAAADHLREGLRIARAHHFRNLEFHCALNLARFSFYRESCESSLRHATLARDIALRQRNRANLVRALAMMAQILVRSGRLPQAERVLAEALDLGTAGVPKLETLRVKLVLLEIHVWHRRIPVDPIFLSETEDLANEEGNTFLRRNYTTATALQSLLTGTEEGAVLALLGDSPTEKSSAPWHRLAQGRIAEKFERLHDAAVHAEAAVDLIRRGMEDRFLLAFALLDLVRYREALGRTDALEAAEECIGLARVCGARRVEAEALMLAARIRAGADAGE